MKTATENNWKWYLETKIINVFQLVYAILNILYIVGPTQFIAVLVNFNIRFLDILYDFVKIWYNWYWAPSQTTKDIQL